MKGSSKVVPASVLRRNFVLLAAIFGMLAVLAGAFGAHALREVVAPRLLEVWATAVRYQMWHALALLGVAMLVEHLSSVVLRWLMCVWIAGICLFSGSLYLLVLSGIKLFGALTPFGGLLLIVGWGLLAVSAWRTAR
jgi:uncharacterized membrane protein YgdD (TMEM256/DUF423 family)